MTFITANILKRGFLPKELPPPFTSTTLGQHYAALPDPGRNDSYCLRSSYSKYSTVRRSIAIPNPAHFVPLAKAVSDDWHVLKQHCERSPLSRTKPVTDTIRAIAWGTALDQMSRLRAETRVGARYVLQADVAACYGSMYTHAIPWALHTKAVSKVDRRTKPSSAGPLLSGNLLDLHSRNIQSGQTIGFPIGPDTSLPLAEAILASVDLIVQDRLKCQESAFRFVDDYEIATATLAEAERARNVLQDALAEYELQLNPRKTRILEVPNSLDSPWVQELSAFSLGSPKQNVLEAQLLRYFSRAFDLANSLPGEPVLKYAVRRLSEVDTGPVARLVQRLLFQTAVSDPGTLHTALYIAWEHQLRGLSVDAVSLGRALDAIIVRHAPLQHGGDLAWALWGAIVFGIKLQQSAITALESVTDPIGILMTLLAEEKGTFAAALQKTQWLTLAQNDQLFDKHWMVTYEAPGHAWLAPGVDPALSDPFFSEARRLGVTLIDSNTTAQIPEPSAAGEYA